MKTKFKLVIDSDNMINYLESEKDARYEQLNLPFALGDNGYKQGYYNALVDILDKIYHDESFCYYVDIVDNKK